MDGPADGRDPLGDHLERWVAEQRIADAATSRRREGWLRRQAAEEGTLAGVLVDLGERQRRVVVDLVGARRVRGVVRSVGGDFVGLCDDGGDTVLVRTAAIASLRAEPRSPPTVGHRFATADTSFGEVLSGLAGDRPRVLAATIDGGTVTGVLRSVGRDLLVLRPDDGAGDVYVRLDGLAEVALS